MKAFDVCRHLVQNEEFLTNIHESELPPEEYYEKLRPILTEKLKGCDPSLVEHGIVLTWAFDTATAFSMSFGINKFQVAQMQVNVVGKLVGREGRMPNSELLKAIHEWLPIKTLKDLQSLLGTMNYVRPHAGPEYARLAAPLRCLLKPGGPFPPTKEQHEALEKLKQLFVCDAVLRVADERAALIAANFWISGNPPTQEGQPLEVGLIPLRSHGEES